MPTIDISNIDLKFSDYSYTIEEIVDDLFSDKLDEGVKKFAKKELGIERIYKAYDLSKVTIKDPQYLVPDIRLNDMYVEIAERILRFTKRKPSDISLLITINDNQQHLDPSPTVEITTRLGLNKDVRTQNFQGMACSSFSEALRNASGHFELGYKGDVLVLIGTYYTNWFLDRIKQIDRISIKNRNDFNNFIYFLIFSDVTSGALLSQSEGSSKCLVQIDIKTISSRKDTSMNGYKKATINLVPNSHHRITFDMVVNTKILRETAAGLSAENVAYIKQKFPKDFNKVKSWGLHPAGKMFVDYVRERCHITKNRSKLTYDLMRETGNTGAVSSMQLIKESIERKILCKGDLGGIVDYGWDGADAFLYKIY
jgi:3-oxoacyl-[acyl-carrier-protein] synthase III